jgi:hypothetical protein
LRVTYELNVCVESAAGMPERYATLHRNVLDVFNEYGVQIMTPAYEGDRPSEARPAGALGSRHRRRGQNMSWHCPSYVLRSISGGRTIPPSLPRTLESRRDQADLVVPAGRTRSARLRAAAAQHRTGIGREDADRHGDRGIRSMRRNVESS